MPRSAPNHQELREGPRAHQPLGLGLPASSAETTNVCCSTGSLIGCGAGCASQETRGREAGAVWPGCWVLPRNQLPQQGGPCGPEGALVCPGLDLGQKRREARAALLVPGGRGCPRTVAQKPSAKVPHFHLRWECLQTPEGLTFRSIKSFNCSSPPARTRARCVPCLSHRQGTVGLATSVSSPPGTHL